MIEFSTTFHRSQKSSFAKMVNELRLQMVSQTTDVTNCTHADCRYTGSLSPQQIIDIIGDYLPTHETKITYHTEYAFLFDNRKDNRIYGSARGFAYDSIAKAEDALRHIPAARGQLVSLFDVDTGEIYKEITI